MNQRVVIVGRVENPDAVTAVLDRFSVEAIEVPTPKAALAMLRELPVDLVIASMPPKALESFVTRLRAEKGESHGAEVLAIVARSSAKAAEAIDDRHLHVVPRRGQQAIEDAVTAVLRRTPRLPCRSMVTLGEPGGKGRQMMQMTDLSRTGMFVRAFQRLELGTRVRFEFSIGERERPIRGVAKVVRWTREGSGTSGMGLAFEGFDGDAGDRLEALLDQQMPREDEIPAL